MALLTTVEMISVQIHYCSLSSDSPSRAIHSGKNRAAARPARTILSSPVAFLVRLLMMKLMRPRFNNQFSIHNRSDTIRHLQVDRKNPGHGRYNRHRVASCGIVQAQR